jgi:uncharacterized paraquat-inducible protein A
MILKCALVHNFICNFLIVQILMYFVASVLPIVETEDGNTSEVDDGLTTI